MASTSESDSSVERPLVGDSFARPVRNSVSASHIWLDGDVLACACPDCNAPMTIRIWLSIAECRMCGAAVELTEEQERVARQLLESREAPPPQPAAPRPPPPTWSQQVPQPPALPQREILNPPLPPAPSKLATPPRPRRKLPPKPLIAEAVGPAVLIARPADALPIENPAQEETTARLGRRLFQQLIATLVSLVINMLVMILLGLITFELPSKPVVLHVEVDTKPALPAGKVGGEVVVPKETKKEEPKVEEPKPKELLQPQQHKQPDQLAALPPIDTKKLADQLLPSFVVAPRSGLSSASGSGTPAAGTLLAGRDMNQRAKLVNLDGGSQRTELAVAKGLKWIASHQNRDGSWSLEKFHQTGNCNGQCTATGVTSDTAGTALALLPFLGAGYTHKGDHEYREVVADGLARLVAIQRSDGDLRGRGNGQMYAHGQAAIALCEAYALTGDSKLKGPAQKAIDFIVKAQHSAGGWRYSPGEAGDTSVVGWQIMALRSAQMAKLEVPPSVFARSEQFLTSVQTSSSQGTFGYMPHSRRTEVMTAEGLLCRLYSGWRTNSAPLLHGVDWLLKDHLPDEDNLNMYYVYYATQVMHHIGNERWKKWNERTKRVLVETQEQEGHLTGSWAPTDVHDRAGGRLYMTALAVCSLEVYYRHLPIYKNDILLPAK